MRLDETQELKPHCLDLNWGTLDHFEFLNPRYKSTHGLKRHQQKLGIYPVYLLPKEKKTNLYEQI